MAKQKCATTQEVGAWLCKTCGEEFTPSKFHPKQRHCSRACQNHSARDMEAEMLRELKDVTRNVAYGYLNRDRYIGMDGRYEGPLNKSVTFVESIVKDKGYHPMPIDVHVRAIEPKHVDGLTVHTEGQQFARWHSSFPHTATMPRHHNSFCAICIEVVIDKDKHQVRTTKGVYLPIKHQCNSVRVYDLQGNLLETKSL